MQWDELTKDGSIEFFGVTLLDRGGVRIDTTGIRIDVSQAFDDETPAKRVLLDCHCGERTYRFVMTADKADSLARLLLHSAASLRGQAPHGEGEH